MPSTRKGRVRFPRCTFICLPGIKKLALRNVLTLQLVYLITLTAGEVQLAGTAGDCICNTLRLVPMNVAYYRRL